VCECVSVSSYEKAENSSLRQARNKHKNHKKQKRETSEGRECKQIHTGYRAQACQTPPQWSHPGRA